LFSWPAFAAAVIPVVDPLFSKNIKNKCHLSRLFAPKPTRVTNIGEILMKKTTMILAATVAAFAVGPVLATNTDHSTHAQQTQSATNMFGGAVYTGEPALAVTAALVKAGGGADNFSFATALVAMLGEKTVNAEVAKLTKQYSEEEVNTFIGGMDTAIGFGLKRATEAGVTLPEPADLSGPDLAKTLVKAGTAPDGVFWSGYLFDKALSHELHNQVMADINLNVSYEDDKTTHKILNQAMYDVAQALKMNGVKLADLH
jgi:FlaG/FlaF family flagellin (archaellin)